MRMTCVWVGSVSTPIGALSFAVKAKTIFDLSYLPFWLECGQYLCSRVLLSQGANDGACNGSLIANPLPNFPLPSVEWYSLRRASVPCILSVSLATLVGTYYRYRQGQRPFYMGTGRKESQEKKASQSNALLRLRTTFTSHVSACTVLGKEHF